ncbi:hypothetical protein [Caenispirillum bisanense]|uniref:hypothetical protein n=1 Tax=Caenispirillum bisanense TaxID=414052 RepID=UPI0031CFFA72
MTRDKTPTATATAGAALSRRAVLAAGAAGAVAATVTAPAAALPAGGSEDRLRRLCRTLAGGRSAAAAVAWPVASAEALCREATGLDLGAVAKLSDAEVLAAIADETRRAFRAGQVARVGGWVLARPETAVYRLAAGA